MLEAHLNILLFGKGCFSKTLEKFIYTRILNHLNENNILYEHQYGFRKGDSTFMAHLQLVDKIQTAMNEKKSALGF